MQPGIPKFSQNLEIQPGVPSGALPRLREQHALSPRKISREDKGKPRRHLGCGHFRPLSQPGGIGALPDRAQSSPKSGQTAPKSILETAKSIPENTQSLSIDTASASLPLPSPVLARSRRKPRRHLGDASLLPLRPRPPPFLPNLAIFRLKPRRHLYYGRILPFGRAPLPAGSREISACHVPGLSEVPERPRDPPRQRFWGNLGGLEGVLGDPGRAWGLGRVRERVWDGCWGGGMGV